MQQWKPWMTKTILREKTKLLASHFLISNYTTKLQQSKQYFITFSHWFIIYWLILYFGMKLQVHFNLTYTSNQCKRILILLLTELFELLNLFLISFFFICSHFIVYEISNEISSWLSFYHWFDKATKNLKSMTPEEWGLGTGWVDLVLPFHTGITLIFFYYH